MPEKYFEGSVSDFMANIKELDDEANLLFKVINEKLWDDETSFYYDLWKTVNSNARTGLSTLRMKGHYVVIAFAKMQVIPLDLYKLYI